MEFKHYFLKNKINMFLCLYYFYFRGRRERKERNGAKEGRRERDGERKGGREGRREGKREGKDRLVYQQVPFWNLVHILIISLSLLPLTLSVLSPL